VAQAFAIVCSFGPFAFIAASEEMEFLLCQSFESSEKLVSLAFLFGFESDLSFDFGFTSPFEKRGFIMHLFNLFELSFISSFKR
jgi:hypothetical protein